MEIAVEYAKRAKNSVCVRWDALGFDDDENYFLTFSDLEDQLFMQRILGYRYNMKQPLEDFRLMGIPLPAVILSCEFDGLKIKEPEWHELEYNEHFESIKRGVFAFGNRVKLKAYNDDSVRHVIKELMITTGLESELQLACYLHYNLLLPLQAYADSRESYLQMNDLGLSSEVFEAKRDAIYQQLVLDNKANTRWKNEADLYRVVVQDYPDAVFQYRIGWLGGQSLDIFIPSQKVGIEYQGVQHYEPVEFFGGEEGFQYRVKMDALKDEKCRQNGVRLLKWSYLDLITRVNVRRKVAEMKK